MCPWCILGATHGDLADAQLSEHKLLDELCASSENVAASQTIHFAARWCEELGDGSATLTNFNTHQVYGQDLSPEMTPDAESSASSSSNLAIVPSARAAPVGVIPSLDTSVHVLLFPGIALRRRTVLEAALAGLKTGLQIAISPSGEAVKEATTSAAEDDVETCFHGCNPRCLAEILKSGLLGSLGKRDIFAV